MKPVNTSMVRKPQWTGANGEVAVLVSRGEPNRTDLQMEQAVAAQVRDYLPHFTTVKADELVTALAVQLIAKDYIVAPGFRQVVLTREHLLAFVHAAQHRIDDLKDGADA